MSLNKMHEVMSLILLIGMFCSLLLVMIGGGLYLAAHGHDLIKTEFNPNILFTLSISKIISDALTFSSTGLIELGLLILILTQTIRVALLVWFYSVTRDYWFMSISLFVLVILVYSLCFRSIH